MGECLSQWLWILKDFNAIRNCKQKFQKKVSRCKIDFKLYWPLQTPMLLSTKLNCCFDATMKTTITITMKIIDKSFIQIKWSIMKTRTMWLEIVFTNPSNLSSHSSKYCLGIVYEDKRAILICVVSQKVLRSVSTLLIDT